MNFFNQVLMTLSFPVKTCRPAAKIKSTHYQTTQTQIETPSEKCLKENKKSPTVTVLKKYIYHHQYCFKFKRKVHRKRKIIVLILERCNSFNVLTKKM